MRRLPIAPRRQVLPTLVIGFCAFLLASSPSVAAEIAPTKFVTANGITVLVLEQHFLPIVEIHTLIKAGSAQDPPDKAGLANLVASLLDEGTTTRTSKQQAEQIDFVGGALEAKASEDFTTASARVLKKDIDLGFALLADMLQHPAFYKQEFERIRTQLLGEMASDNTAQSTMISEISAAIGTMDQATQQNAAMVEETSAAARNLTSEVASLANQAAQF